MSCCPTAPSITQGGSPDTTNGIAEVPMLPGESTECYMSTANNPTGKHDDATANVPNKIDTPTIPMKADGTVNCTFRMQKYEGTDPPKRTPTTWTLKDDSGGLPEWHHPAANNVPEKPPEWNANTPVIFTSSGATATLVGHFRIKDYGKKIRCTVTASDANGEIDSKGYVFSPDDSPASDNIQFLHPLPGAVVTSRFNPQRKHPVTGVIKPHNGADFAYGGGVRKDVLAGADGEVIFVGFQAGGAGNYTKIKHLNGAGKHLATSVYMHQESIYVKVGQQVTAGQKIGKEGNTGIGTGAHLHFECRLPNGTAIDPEPLIKGSLQVARETKPDNTAVPDSVETKNDNAVLTPKNVDAKVAGCNPYGPSYPTPDKPAPIAQTSPPTTGDAFALAWALTMDTEVIAWEGSPPYRQTTIDGAITGSSDSESKVLKRRVGFVNNPKDPGGTTKFGVAQKFNKGQAIEALSYQQARDIGYSKYWSGTAATTVLGQGKPKSAIAVFNLGYLCGAGGINQIIKSADISSKDDLQSVNAICDAARNYLLQKIVDKPEKSTFKNGWMARCEKVRAYCKSATVT